MIYNTFYKLICVALKVWWWIISPAIHFCQFSSFKSCFCTVSFKPLNLHIGLWGKKPHWSPFLFFILIWFFYAISKVTPISTVVLKFPPQKSKLWINGNYAFISYWYMIIMFVSPSGIFKHFRRRLLEATAKNFVSFKKLIWIDTGYVYIWLKN